MATKTKKAKAAGVGATEPGSNGHVGAPSPRRLIMTEFDHLNPPFEPCVATYSAGDDECPEPHWVVAEPTGGEPADDDSPTLDELMATIARQAAQIRQADENAGRLRESRKRLDELSAKADKAATAAKEAKKRYEAAIDEHFELEAELDSDQLRLPLGDADEPEPAAAAPAGDESWREVKLSSLDGLPEGVWGKLALANIYTIGDVADRQRSEQFRLTDIDGIGQASADKIDAALAAFWAQRPGAAGDEVGPDDDGDDSGEVDA